MAVGTPPPDLDLSGPRVAAGPACAARGAWRRARATSAALTAVTWLPAEVLPLRFDAPGPD